MQRMYLPKNSAFILRILPTHSTRTFTSPFLTKHQGSCEGHVQSREVSRPLLQPSSEPLHPIQGGREGKELFSPLHTSLRLRGSQDGLHKYFMQQGKFSPKRHAMQSNTKFTLEILSCMSVAVCPCMIVLTSVSENLLPGPPYRDHHERQKTRPLQVELPVPRGKSV